MRVPAYTICDILVAYLKLDSLNPKSSFRDICFFLRRKGAPRHHHHHHSASSQESDKAPPSVYIEGGMVRIWSWTPFGVLVLVRGLYIYILRCRVIIQAKSRSFHKLNNNKFPSYEAIFRLSIKYLIIPHLKRWIHLVEMYRKDGDRTRLLRIHVFSMFYMESNREIGECSKNQRVQYIIQISGSQLVGDYQGGVTAQNELSATRTNQRFFYGKQPQETTKNIVQEPICFVCPSL